MDRRLIVLLFFGALALCALVTKAHAVSWNDGSRIATVDALTADRTFRIDGSPYAAGLGDEIRFRGRTYSDKPPLLAILGAAVATAVAPLGITLRHTPGTAIYLVTLFTVGVWFAIGCCYAYAFQRVLGFAPRVALAVASLSGAGTLALSYATVLTNHVPCGAAALAGCFHLYRSRERSWADAAAAGLFFGAAYAFDAAGAVYAVAALVLLWGAPLRNWAACALAALPVLALQFAYNLAISGSVLPTVFNLSVWSDPSLPLHQIGTTQVLRAFSPAEYAGFAVDHLVGVRGIVPFTPIVLLAGYGLWRMWRARGRERVLALAIAATFVAYVVLIVFLQNDTYSRNFGERRYVDLFFALCVGLGPALTALRGAWARSAALVLAALSIASAALGTIAPFAGRQGEWGFAFALHEFAELQRRAPVQAALDVVLLIVLIGVLLRLTANAMDGSGVSRAAQPRG
ncbi:MAG TPA: hypothetical protein VK665_08130 [Candidatus Elarobacter sp.]|nr:hypothetical protein [Candidatus Elarobacter sp.]